MQVSQMFDMRRKHCQAALMAAAAVFLMLPWCASGAITPAISSISDPVIVGDSLTISGSGFTARSVANFFVATGTGAIDFGPLTPSAHSAMSLTVQLPSSTVTTLGQGVVSVVVVTPTRALPNPTWSRRNCWATRARVFPICSRSTA